MNKIDCFDGEFAFLSNFYPCEIYDKDGLRYDSVEAAFQAQKTTVANERNMFTMLNPSQAKKLGRKVALRADWDDIKDSIMEGFVRQKFSISPLKEKLLSTGDAILIEGNYWKDHYWGVCKGIGQNKLGNILMKVREELKS
jgi:ribA/ribD-fused uncharacterized protein